MKRKPPPSLQETLERNAAIMRGYARLAGKEFTDNDPIFNAPAPKEKKTRAVRTKPTIPLEKEIQADIVLYLRKIGASVTRHNSGVMHEGDRYVRFNMSAGHSDLSGTLPGGRSFFFEVKRPGLQATTVQQKFLANRARVGALCAVVHSVEEVQLLIAGA